MHRLTAKKARGFEKAHNVFWRYLHVAMATHAPVVLTRDFNMSLFQVVPKLRNLSWPIELLSWYTWVKIADAARLSESEEGDRIALADAGKAEVMYSSCCIFFLCHQRKMNRFLNLEDTQGSEKVVSFAQGQGYPIKCYLGGKSALQQSLARLPEMKRASEVSDHDPATHTRSKLVDSDSWTSSRECCSRAGARVMTELIVRIFWFSSSPASLAKEFN